MGEIFKIDCDVEKRLKFIHLVILMKKKMELDYVDNVKNEVSYREIIEIE